tara:strand:- start:1933 stop:3084 length:1152 start_codon:yes stop_codon:yes gene_type:complete
MAYFKFKEDDLFINTVETHPDFKFYIQSGSIYINNYPHFSGSNTDNIIGVPKGFISLYEYNIDRISGVSNQIRPFIIKSGPRMRFNKTASGSFNYQTYGTVITSSYNMSASITRLYYNTTTRNRIKALENVFNHYSYLSPQYQYSSSFGDKATQTINLIAVPSIFYGSSIKKGSVDLKYYVSGTLVGQLQDSRFNGDLVQVGPEGSTGSGSVAGSILYNEGLISLTGSWSLDNHSIQYDVVDNSKWIYFGFGANDGNSLSELSSLSSSFSLEYKGINNIQTMTMFAHARYGELNHSTNPTFVVSPTKISTTASSNTYIEDISEIKNIVSSSFTDQVPKFEKTIYISKVGIYDKDRNLIGIAKMATPVRKTEDDQYTFKLKLDI